MFDSAISYMFWFVNHGEADDFIGSSASIWKSLSHTLDGRNPANQLGDVVYPIIYKVF